LDKKSNDTFENRDSMKVLPSWSFILYWNNKKSTIIGWFDILHGVGTFDTAKPTN